MNRAIAREIVGCLLAPSASVQQLARLAGMGRRDWEHALEWLDHSGIALLFWNRLKEVGEENRIPPETGERLESNLADHRVRVAAMTGEFDSINRCLEGAGVPYAALKGFALIPQYCPDIFLRTTYDYDYLVARDSVSRAERALKAAGYLRKERTEGHPIVYFHNTRRPRSPLSRNDLYSGAFPRTIELHYLFWDSRPVKIPLNLPGNPLAQLELRHLSPLANPPGQPSGQPTHFYALPEEDELIFQALHVFRHILHNWCRLCSLLDIAYFLDHRALDAAFWDRFCERLKQSRPLSEMVGVVFLLAARLFGATIPAPVSSQVVLRLPSPLALWVDRYGLDSALNNFSGNKFGLFLHREFIQEAATWRAIQRSHLFPIHRPNQAVHTPNSTLRSHLAAGWKQWFYVAQRLKHHVVATLRYGLESPRWERAYAHAAADCRSAFAGNIQHGAARQRILFLEQQSWRSGAERVLDEALRALEPEFLPLVAFPDEGPFAAELRRRGVETLYFPLGRYRSGRKSIYDIASFPLRSLHCAFQLSRIIRARKVKLVYINSPRCLVAGVLAAQFTGRPSLFHLHMTMTRGADLLVARWASSRLTKIVACSKTAASSLAKSKPSLEGSIQVIYNPVRKPRFPAPSTPLSAALAALLRSSKQPVVGVVGRINPQKGQHILLEAARELVLRGWEIQIVFVGAPDKSSHEDLAYTRFLQSRIRDLGLEKRVHWSGYLEDPNPIYAILDALVIPSTFNEGLPLVALEALQWGVPVIGSRVGGIPEVIQDGVNGLLTKPGDAGALAKCIERWLENAEFRAALQTGARKSIGAAFSVDTFRREIRNALFELIPAADGAGFQAVSAAEAECASRVPLAATSMSEPLTRRVSQAPKHQVGG
ncbi:MAG: nucleotidyltransferase family protein [Terriglobia bacterium]